MVGFLFAGFLLSTQNIVDANLLSKMADLGITLLLFTIGLKIQVQNLARPQVWAVTSIHSTLIIITFSLIIYTMSLIGAKWLPGFSFQDALLVAFALSFLIASFAGVEIVWPVCSGIAV